MKKAKAKLKINLNHKKKRMKKKSKNKHHQKYLKMSCEHLSQFITVFYIS